MHLPCNQSALIAADMSERCMCAMQQTRASMASPGEMQCFIQHASMQQCACSMHCTRAHFISSRAMHQTSTERE